MKTIPLNIYVLTQYKTSINITATEHHPVWFHGMAQCNICNNSLSKRTSNNIRDTVLLKF